MPDTYTQIHIQAIFAVKYRAGVIQPNWKNELYKYITGIVRENRHRLLAINGVSDHIHILFGMRPAQSLSDLMRVVKTNSSKWINDRSFVKGRFEWQEGYGAFSYDKRQLPSVIHYIQNQEIHHQNQTFLDEYKGFLEEFAVEYDSRNIFKALE